MVPSPEQAARGQREALEAVRRVMANLPPVSGENPLGLPLDGQGRALSINVKGIPGEERQARFDRGNRFCAYLNRRDGWVAAFDQLSHFHQIVAILLADNINQQPDLVKDWFLTIDDNCRHLAITRSGHSATISRQ